MNYKKLASAALAAGVSAALMAAAHALGASSGALAFAAPLLVAAAHYVDALGAKDASAA